MLQRSTVVGACVALLVGLLATVAPVSAVEADGQPRDENRFVNLDNVVAGQPKTFADVEPNEVANVNGSRIELYTSMGDLEGGMDWRSINLFSYLINSVPKYKHSYTALFNSLYDEYNVSYTGGIWTTTNRAEVYAPTAAYMNQLNMYTPSERGQYIHVLGAKQSMEEALNAKSSLARVLMHSSNRSGATPVYSQCKHGNGGCLTSPYNSSALMHAKYGAFEQAADSEGNIRDHVIFVTSSNLNGSSGSKKTNTSIVIYGDEQLYNSVVNDIYGSKVAAKDDNKNGRNHMTPGYRSSITVSGGTIPGFSSSISGAKLYPSPRAVTEIKSGTTLLTQTDVESKFLLDRANAGNITGCRVYLIHSLFNSTRSGAYDALSRLAQRDCDVRVVLGTNAIADVVDGYFTMSTDLRQVVDRIEFANVHDKSISYSDNSVAAMFGGSTNLTGTSMNYDELAFRVDERSIVSAKQQHDERVYGAARGTTWKDPSSVAIDPGTVRVRTGESVKLTTKVSPSNALVTNTVWTSLNPGIASVDATGKVTGLSNGTATIKVEVDSPNLAAPKTSTRVVTVSGSQTTTGDSARTVTVPPVLTMERYQGPKKTTTDLGTTDVVITWGGPGEDYSGNVRLQYYKGGWKNYKTVKVVNGIARTRYAFANSKTWRAVGTSVTAIKDSETGQTISKGKLSGNLVSKGYSYVTVRTKPHKTTPRLYATSMAAKGKIPFGLSFKKSKDKVRLQYKSGSKWKTKATVSYNGSWDMFLGTASSSRYWRVVTSSGRVSNSVKVTVR